MLTLPLPPAPPEKITDAELIRRWLAATQEIDEPKPQPRPSNPWNPEDCL